MPVHDVVSFYLAHGIAISLFFIMQYLGFALVRYFNR